MRRIIERVVTVVTTTTWTITWQDDSDQPASPAEVSAVVPERAQSRRPRRGPTPFALDAEEEDPK